MVCLIGADSAVGAPLAMLLQRSKLIDDVALYGRTRPERLAAELTCIPARPIIAAYGSEDEGLRCALDGAQVVVLAEGAFRSNAINRDQHFRTHAKSACEYGTAIGEDVPNALVGVLTNPISAMMPLVWECVRRAGGRQPERRVMGVATLTAGRVAAQVSRVVKADPRNLKIYVGGGTCGSAAVPLLSAMPSHMRLTQLEASAITTSVAGAGSRIRRALQHGFGCIVPCKEDGKDLEDCGSCAFGGHTKIGMFMPSFSIAYAANKWIDAAVRAVSGHRCVETNAFVVSHVANFSAEFSTTPVVLSRNGVLKRLPLPTPSESEAILLEAAHELLRKDVIMAKDYLTKMFGESKRPIISSPSESADCTAEERRTGPDIFRICREDFYPEAPPCPTSKQGCHGADYYGGEDDPCAEIYKRAK